MSTPQRMRPDSRFPKVPEGDVVASYDSYEQAQKAVDQLARNEGFTVQAISIVGSDLKSVERVTGRMSLWKAALNGAVSGVFLGMFFTAVFVLLDPNANLAVMLGVLLLATVFGAVWGLILYAISPNKREFASVMQLTASCYEVMVPRTLSGEARRILGTGSWDAVPPQVPASGAEYGQPNAYGQQEPPVGTSAYGQPGYGQPEPAEPAAPAGPPRTYGEMLDEQRRREVQQARATEAGSVADLAGELPPDAPVSGGSNGSDAPTRGVGDSTRGASDSDVPTTDLDERNRTNDAV